MKTLGLMLCLIILGVLAGAACAAEAPPPPPVEVHGFLQMRYYVDTVIDDTRDLVTGEITDKVKQSHLEIERISLSGLARLPEGKTAYGEIYIHPWLPNDDPAFLYLESLFVDLPQTPSAKVRVGKGRDLAFGIVPAFGNRKFSNYSPVEETFTMDRVLGLQALSTCGKNTFNFAILNSQRPGTRYIGMAADQQLDVGGTPGGSLPRTTVAHLSNRDTPADRSGDLELDARVTRQLGSVSVGLSGRVGRLDETDRAFMASKFGKQVDLDDDMRKQWGLDALYKCAPYFATVQYYAGPTAGINQNGWQVLVGVEPSKQCTAPWDDFAGVCKGLYVRYSKLNIGVNPLMASPITWDTNQLGVSWAIPLPSGSRPGLGAKWLQIEWERNREEVPNGGDDIPNDVLFLEAFFAF